MAPNCSWSTATRNCHDNACHEASACPVVLGDCSAPNALWWYNSSTGVFVSHFQDPKHVGLNLCLDAGTTYPNTACNLHDGSDKLPFCDPSLPTQKRAADIVGRMTLAEQLQQLLTEAPAIPRLGIGRYQYWGEALHGIIGPGTTVFPQVIGLAASFNKTACKRAPKPHLICHAVLTERCGCSF